MPGVGSYTYNEMVTLMHPSVVLGQLLQLSRVARLSWGLATLEYDRLVVSSPIKNIDFRFGRPFPFPFSRFRVFQLPPRAGIADVSTIPNTQYGSAGPRPRWFCGGDHHTYALQGR